MTLQRPCWILLRCTGYFPGFPLLPSILWYFVCRSLLLRSSCPRDSPSGWCLRKSSNSPSCLDHTHTSILSPKTLQVSISKQQFYGHETKAVSLPFSRDTGSQCPSCRVKAVPVARSCPPHTRPAGRGLEAPGVRERGWGSRASLLENLLTFPVSLLHSGFLYYYSDKISTTKFSILTICKYTVVWH